MRKRALRCIARISTWGLASMVGMALLATLGCFASSPAPQMLYFRLPLWEGVSRQAGPAIPAVVQVDSLDVQPDYDHLRLVYRVSPEQLRHYRLRQWVVKPGRMLQGALQRFLAATGAFREVTDTPRPIPDYVLRGRLFSLEQVEEGERRRDTLWFASAEMELSLHRATDNQAIWQVRFSEREHVKEKTVGQVVTTLTRLLRERLVRELPGLLGAMQRDLASR